MKNRFKECNEKGILEIGFGVFWSSHSLYYHFLSYKTFQGSSGNITHNSSASESIGVW